MKALRNVYMVLSIFFTLPIWFYLMHYVLAAAHPDRLVWFLFWLYIPISIFSTIISRIVDSAAMDERFEAWVKKQGRRI